MRAVLSGSCWDTRKALGAFFALSGGSFCLPALAWDIDGTELSASGRIAAGVDVTGNVARSDGTSGTVVRGASNQWGTSLLTLGAQRNLPNELQGYAVLESGFGADHGASNDTTLWSRRSYVGIRNEGLGYLQFGKNVSVSSSVYDLDPMGLNWSGAATLVGGRNWGIAPSTIEYGSPALQGWRAVMQYSPGGQVQPYGAGTRWALDLNYENGPLKTHVIYDEVTCATTQSTCTPGRMDNVYTASKETILGAAYAAGSVTYFVGWSQLVAPDADDVTAPRSAQQTWFGVNVQTASPLLLRGAVYWGGSDKDISIAASDGAQPYGGGSATLLALGADYHFDQHVMWWVTLAFMNNGAQARFSSEDYWDAIPAAGQNQTTVNTGLVLSF